MTKVFKKALTDRAKGFGINDQSFLDTVDYKEFNYSEFFDLIRKQFAENAQARKKGFSYLTGKGFEETLLKPMTTLEANFGKDEFFLHSLAGCHPLLNDVFRQETAGRFHQVFQKVRPKAAVRSWDWPWNGWV